MSGLEICVVDYAPLCCLLLLSTLASGRAADVDVHITATLADLHAARLKRIAVRVRRPAGGEQRQCVFVSMLDPAPLHRFCGVGDASPLELLLARFGGGAMPRGDIVVHVSRQEEAACATPPGATVNVDTVLDAHDLHANVPVPLLTYLYGGRVLMTHLDGRVLELDYPAQSGRRVVLFPGLGLPRDTAPRARGDLTVFLNVALGPFPAARLAPVRALLTKVFAQ